MNESLLTNFAVIILFLPLLGFIVTLLLGKKVPGIFLFENLVMLTGLVLSIVLLTAKVTAFSNVSLSSEFMWIDMGSVPVIGEIKIFLGLLIDDISALMIFVVFLISFLVHFFSIDYMKGDIRYNRYFAYLGLFTFSMAGIVLTHNMLMMYIFWELVGVSSYLLIGFWYEKKSASDAGKKAFIVNRIGDLGFLLGLLTLFITYNTFSFTEIFSEISQGNLPLNSQFGLTLTGIFIFCGAVGKSAQFPLHVWLPDAMEGPTPVSALIHAATMVAAGVYLIVRIFGILTADAMLVIATIGALSALIPATIALTQNDIKRVLAYSTVSQLGYMVMALGVGAYKFAFFHLITHAFFKACLFLGSGSVIHAMHHEQDIQNMGGLRKKMPVTYATFLVSAIAISGIPLTSGFLSKDGILAGSYAFASLTGHWFFPFIGFLVAMMTAFYMFRLIILTFHGKPRSTEKYEQAHESSLIMVLPLVVLSILSLFIWYTPNPMDPEAGWMYTEWIKNPVLHTPENLRFGFMQSDVIGDIATPGGHEIMYSEKYTSALHNVHGSAVILSIAMAVLGILLAFVMYQWKKINADKVAKRLKMLYKFSYNKWYFDELYYKTFVAGTLGLSKLVAWFDLKVIDGIVDGSAAVTKAFSAFIGKFDDIVIDGLVNFTAYISGIIGVVFQKFQTGKVQTYIIMVIFSLVILLFLFKSF